MFFVLLLLLLPLLFLLLLLPLLLLPLLLPLAVLLLLLFLIFSAIDPESGLLIVSDKKRSPHDVLAKTAIEQCAINVTGW